jgi:hypothetical protein
MEMNAYGTYEISVETNLALIKIAHVEDKIREDFLVYDKSPDILHHIPLYFCDPYGNLPNH